MTQTKEIEKMMEIKGININNIKEWNKRKM